MSKRFQLGNRFFVNRLRNHRGFLSTFQLSVLLSALMYTMFPVITFSREEPWGVDSSVAVVNPAVSSPLQKVISLRGEWDFVYGDQAIHYRLGIGDAGWGSRSFDWSSARKIQVPGCWESQGVGEPGRSISWDCNWDCGDWELKHIYMGVGLYKKTVDIPDDWQNSQVWLKVGGVRSEAYFWVNGQRAAHVNNYCGTEKFNITPFIQSGKPVEITAIVRNDTPSRKGLYAANHRFGGFYRDIELEAMPTTYLDDVWVRGDVDQKMAEVHVTVDSVEQTTPLQNTVHVNIQTRLGEVVGDAVCTVDKKGEQVVRIPIENCQLWTPETPHLYLANVELCDANGAAIQGRIERFGVRKLEVRGRQFYLNGQPYFLRGAGDHNYDTAEIIEPPQRERFLEHMKIYKAAGFNAMRHHTHAPLPEYFEAADEMGLLLQPELPYYHDVPTEAFEFNPMREMIELVTNYRRYTSFAVMSGGNEGYLGHPLDEQMYQWMKEHDPDRMVLNQDGGRNMPTNSDFATGGVPNYSGALIVPWAVGSMDYLDRPFVAHEYLNLAIKMDPKLEDRFTGVRVSPVSMDKYRALLEKCHLTETWGEACCVAMEKLQAYYQKQGLEAARLDPACDGYYFWSIVDASIPQGSTVAAQGWLNAFWEPRTHGNQPEDFYQFNGPTALLMTTDLDAPIVTEGDHFQATFHISHYDAQPIAVGQLRWELNYTEVQGGQKSLVSGTFSHETIEAGFAGKLAEGEISIPEVQNPIRAELTVTLDDAAANSDTGSENTSSANPNPITNQWTLWIFPKREKKSLDHIVVAPELADWFQERYTNVSIYRAGESDPNAALVVPLEDIETLCEGIAEGRSILAISSVAKEPNVALGWWSIGTQVGTAFADHPVFGSFPNSPWMDELWFRLIRRGAKDLSQSLPLGQMEPLAVGEGRDSYYLYLGENRIQLKTRDDTSQTFDVSNVSDVSKTANVSNASDVSNATQPSEAKVLATFAIDLLQDTPESLWLLDQCLDYVRSDAFDPTVRIDANPMEISLPDGTTLGWMRVRKTTCEPGIWYTYRGDDAMQYVCRQDKIGNLLEWETAKITLTESANETNVEENCTFVFAGGMGYATEPSTDGFELLLNGQPVLKFDLPKSDQKSTIWTSDDGAISLKFDVLRLESNGQDFLGKFYLTVPASCVRNGEPTLVGVRSLDEGSLRWFGVNPLRNLRD